MDDNGWTSQWQESGKPDGMMLFHAHKHLGLADAAVLDVLAAGPTVFGAAFPRRARPWDTPAPP
jgi:hypothetical protein